MKLVHWPLTDGQLHLVQRGWDWTGPQPALQAPPRCTKCFSKRYGNVPTGTSITGASNAGVTKKIAILDPSLYLRNDTMATVTMQLLWTPPLWRSPLEHIPKLSNGTIFDDLERPLIKISRLRHYLTLNISETVHEIQT